MATFPAIEPLHRSYDFPDFPMEEESAWPGVTVRYRTGYDPLAVAGMVLRLEYEKLREAEIQLIRNHWRTQQGGIVDFNLPAIIWQGNTSGIAPALARWRYLAPPEETHKRNGRYDVIIELEAQPFLTVDELAPPPPPPPEPPVLAIAAASADKDEGDSGSTAFTFTVTRAGDTSGSSSASWAVTGSGTDPATAADFTGAALPSGTVSFAAGETSKTVTVNVAGDTTDEPDEGFTVTLSSPTGATLGTATATGVIQDDDSIPSGPILATYSQRSAYVGNTAATQAGMTNGITAEATQTGTNAHSTDADGSWVQMDFGAETAFSRVAVGADFDNTLAGGWGKFYAENCEIIGSNNGTTWTVLANTGTFTQALQEYSTPGASYRYVRIRKFADYLAVTEFYALP